MLLSQATALCCLVLTAATATESPPLITLQPDKQIVYQLGDTVALPCAASGFPMPTYSWTHNEQDLPIGSDGVSLARSNRVHLQGGSGTLIINETKAHDQGYYSCRATSVLGTAVSNTVLLVRAMLENFPKAGGGTLKADVGKALSIACGPRLPSSFPSPSIFWTKWNEAKHLFLPFDYNARISQDLDGLLHFSNVFNSDAGRYRCYAHNTMLRRAAYSSETTITIVAGDVSAEETPPILLYASPKTTVMEGETLRLKCIFGGYPTPSVAWARPDGRTLSVYATTEVDGQELTIRHATFDDSGSYKCSGHGQASANPANAAIIVTVYSAPRFALKPESVVRGENESVSFHCKGDGVPKPTTAWFINGKPITGFRDRLLVNDDNFTLLNLKTDDTMAIQCNISNSHTGWDATSFYIHVLNEAPKITVPFPKNLKLSEGLGATLHCTASGHPQPRVYWQKNGQDIVDSFTDGTLRIAVPMKNDSGVYTCVASNGVGVASTSVPIDVRSPTRIITAPQPLTVVAGNMAILDCEATTDALEIENLVIRWQKEKHDISFDSVQHGNKVMQGNSLQINPVDVLDSGTYTCAASNGIDSVQASAKLIAQGLPTPPVGVKIIECEPQHAVLQWVAGADNNAAILGYFVEYNTPFDPAVWHNSGYRNDTTDTRWRIQLSPWTNYTFRMIAKNAIGISEPSQPTLTHCSTPPDVPSTNPIGVRTVDEDATKLVIVWQSMPMIERNGPGFYYEVTYYKEDPLTEGFVCPTDIICHLYTTEQEGTTSQLTDYKFEVANQTAYTAYNISVKAHNAMGASKGDLNHVIGYSGEGVPEVFVSDFAIDPSKEVTAHTVSFVWTHVSTDVASLRGLFRGYKIRYWKVGEEQRKRSVSIILHRASHESSSDLAPQVKTSLTTRLKKRNPYKDSSLDGSTVTATIRSLPPYTQLYFDVAVINKKFSGQESLPVLVHTIASTPSGVQDVSTVELGPSHIIVAWALPEEPNGQITGFTVAYKLLNNSQWGELHYVDPQLLSADTRRARISNLRPRQLYRISIWAHTSAGQGDESFMEESTLSQGYPDAPKMLLTIITDCNTCINVSWIPAGTGMAASTFYVEHRLKGDETWQATANNGNADWLALTNLSRGSFYEIRAIASNGEDYKTPGDIITINMAAKPVEDTAAEPQTVFASAWFIGLICGVVILIMALIIILILRQRHAGRYSVNETHEKEKLKPDDEDRRSSKPYTALQQSSRHDIDLESLAKGDAAGSDDDSAAEFQEEDAGKFNEDGSFIGAYHQSELDYGYQDSSDDMLPTLGAPNGDDKRKTQSVHSRPSPPLSTFQQHIQKSAHQQPQHQSQQQQTVSTSDTIGASGSAVLHAVSPGSSADAAASAAAE